jgi:dTDP-4-dehydrorhamnose reductase
LAQKPRGVYHLSASGETTWYGFAKAILEDAGLKTPVIPIRSDQYPTAARRPKNSLLDNSKLRRTLGIALPDWRQGLREVSSKIESH